MKKSLVLFLPVVSAIAPLSITLSCSQTSTDKLDHKTDQNQNDKLPNQVVKPNLDFKPNHSNNSNPSLEESKPSLPTIKDENVDLDFGINTPQLPDVETKPETTNQVIKIADLEVLDELVADQIYQIDYKQINSINNILEQLNFKDHPILAILNHNVITPYWIFENQKTLFGNNVHLSSEKEIAKIMTIEDPSTTKLIISILTTNDQVVKVELTGFKVDPSLAQTQSQWPFNANKLSAFNNLNQNDAIALINQNFIVNNIDQFLSGTTRFIRATDIVNLEIKINGKFVQVDFDVKSGRAIEGNINNFRPTTKSTHFSTVIDFN